MLLKKSIFRLKVVMHSDREREREREGRGRREISLSVPPIS